MQNRHLLITKLGIYLYWLLYYFIWHLTKTKAFVDKLDDTFTKTICSFSSKVVKQQN